MGRLPGAAAGLLLGAERRARERGIERLEAWTGDDAAGRARYEARGFELVSS